MSNRNITSSSACGLWLGALLLSLALGACGGGGGGGGGGGPNPPTGPSPLVFTPSGASGSGTITLAQGAGTTNDRLVVEVRGTDLAGFYATAFDLTYPSAVLQLTQSVEGTFANGGGVTTSFQVNQAQAGNLVVGLTRLGNAGGASGSGTLASFTFNVVGSGTGNFVFRNNLVYGADGRAILGVAWGGASVQSTR